MLGDHLGLNEIFDCVGSFNDTVFCRICKATPGDWKQMCCEKTDILRNRQNYEEDPAWEEPRRTGIVRKSVFNTVLGFYVLDNVSFDIMHDYLHGVLKYIPRSTIFDFV